MIKILLFLMILRIFACSNDKDVITENTSNKFKIICINSHQYYEGFNRLAIRLDDEGKPVKCNISKK